MYRYDTGGVMANGEGIPGWPVEVRFFLAMKDRLAYGYELAARFRKMTKGHIRGSLGTNYPFLRRTERRGIIKSSRDEGSGRVHYALTPKVEQLKGRF
jgi:DNA-binding PadR family transcriptional regulator